MTCVWSARGAAACFESVREPHPRCEQMERQCASVSAREPGQRVTRRGACADAGVSRAVTRGREPREPEGAQQAPTAAARHRALLVVLLVGRRRLSLRRSEIIGRTSPRGLVVAPVAVAVVITGIVFRAPRRAPRRCSRVAARACSPPRSVTRGEGAARGDMPARARSAAGPDVDGRPDRPRGVLLGMAGFTCFHAGRPAWRTWLIPGGARPSAPRAVMMN